MTYHALPSKAAGQLFLRHADGCLPGSVCAKNIVAIGLPKAMTSLPRFIHDPLAIESSLMLLAQLDKTQFLACPGSLRKALDRNPERSTLFYKEGIRVVELNKHHQKSVIKSPCVPSSLMGANES